MAKNSVRTRRPASSSPLSAAGDRVAALGDIVEFVYRRKLWWLIPLIVALVVLSLLLLVEATPLGPLIYPVF